MEPKKILFNINDDLKSSVIKYAAYYVDGSKDGVKDGNIDESEKEELTKLLSQNTIYQDELKNEAPNIAKIFGYTQSAEATVAEEVTKGAESATQKVQPKTEVSKYSTVLTEYTKLRQTGKGPYEAYKKVEEKYEDKDEFKSALNELKVKAKEIDAQVETINAIGQSKTTESKKQVKRDAKAVLEKQDGGKIDKWHKKAINGNNNVVTWLSGQDSAIKELRGGQLYGNRADKVKQEGVTMEAIVKRLGEDCPYLQKTEKNGKQVTLLEAAGLMTVRPDGKYDISKLSDFVYDNGTGADNSQSRQQNKPVREAKLLIAELNAEIKSKTGIDLSKTRIKDKYSKRLVKLTGRHVEHKNIVAQAYENTVGGILASTLGTAGALFFGAKDIVKGVVTNKNHLDFTLELEGFSNLKSDLTALTNDPEIKKMLEEGTASIVTSGTKVNIVVDQKQVQPFMHVASKHYLANALRSGVIGGALGLLSSALSYGESEQEVIPNKTDCKTYDEYVTYIDSMVTNKAVKPVYGEIAKLIAYSFIDDKGVFHCAEMNEFLGKKGSNGSRLNRAELMEALIARRTEFDKPKRQIEEKKEKPAYTGLERNIEGEVIKQKAPKTEKFEDWGVFASRYKCIEDYDKNFKVDPKTKDANLYARTMMKVMQAIKDDDYDIVRLQELTQKAMSKNWRAELQNVPGFDFKAYAALRGNKQTHTFGMTKQNMPTITITDGQMVKSDLCAPTAPLYKIGAQSGGIGKKVNLGDANNSRKGADRYEGHLKTSDGEVISTNDKKVYDSEKANLGKTYKWIEPDKAKF